MKLYELIKAYPVRYFTGSATTEVTSIAYDCRQVLPGSIFVCISGANSDGHSFVKEAVERGASTIMARYPFPETWEADAVASADVNVIAVEDTRDALAYISRNYYLPNIKNYHFNLWLGYIGKGTGSQLFHAFMEKHGLASALLYDMRLRYGATQKYLSRKHPEMPELCALLSELPERELILPLGMAELSLARGRYLKPDSIILMQATGTGAHELQELCADNTKLLYNADAVDPEYIYDLGHDRQGVISFGIDEAADIRARDLHIKTRAMRTGTGFNVDFPDGSTQEFFLAMPGRQNVYNALALLAWAYLKNLDIAQSAEFFAEAYLPGCSEQIVCASDVPGEPFNLIIDSAWRPDHLQVLLSSLRPYCRNRILLLAGAGGNRSVAMRREIALMAAQLADYVCFSVNDPRSEGAESVLEDMAMDLPEGTAYSCYLERSEAIKALVSMAAAGDLLVLTGKGDESYVMGADQQLHFSDSEYVQQLLGARILSGKEGAAQA